MIRPATAIAIASLSGALLGALAAAVVVPLATERPSTGGEADAAPAVGVAGPTGSVAPSAAPRSPTAPTAAAAPEASSAAPASAASASASALAAPSDDWLEGQVPTTPAEVEAATQRCARGAAVECLRAGNAYESGSGVPADARRAQLHRSAGARLHEQGCRRRDPEACHALAALYSLGRGVPKSPKTAAAYRGLARDLCQVAPTPACTRLGDGTQE